MKLTALICTVASLSACSAAPVTAAIKHWKRADNMTAPTDVEVLQYALTLENLEAAFYKQGLDKYSAQDFEDAGFPDWVRGRVSEIAMHEQTHVDLLSAALGNSSVAACEYSFPYSTVKEFLILACGLENIGVSAYAGANQYITDPMYSTVAATILSVEARHQAFFYAPVLKQAPWTGPFDTPLDLNMVYTLAAQLITSCPSSNVALPVMAYPTLTVTSPPADSMVASSAPPIFNGMPGATIPLTYEGSDSGSDQYAAIYNGLGSVLVKIEDGSFIVPAGIQGYSFVLVTSSSDIGGVNSGNIIAGPAEMQTGFNSKQANPGYMNPYGA